MYILCYSFNLHSIIITLSIKGYEMINHINEVVIIYYNIYICIFYLILLILH
jgi:hypothetical protein